MRFKTLGEPKQCVICVATFTHGRSDRRVCSTACRNKRVDRYRKTSKADRQRQYRANRKARGLAAQTWTPALRDSYHRRRAAKAGGEIDVKLHFTEIAERDRWCCGICGAAVDPLLFWPDQMSGSIDHVVPLSQGGRHEFANVQLAHVRCNTSKGARIAS